MTSDTAIARLTNSQKECLRLVGQGMSSKENAIATGLSPQTVDTYIKSANQISEVSSRREAARKLLDAERSQKSGYPSEPVVREDEPGEQSSQSEHGAEPGGNSFFRLPPVGGEENALDWAERSFAILKIGVLGFTVAAGIALVTAGIFWAFS